MKYLSLIVSIMLIALSIWLLSFMDGVIPDVKDFAVKVCLIFFPFFGIFIGVIMFIVSYGNLKLKKNKHIYTSITD